MEKTIICLLLSLFSFNHLKAQSNWNGDKIVCENREYKTKVFDSGNVLLYASSNKLRDDKMNLPSNVDFHPSQLVKNNQEITKIFWKVFSENKLQQLAKEKNLQLIFNINSEGCVIELEFLFHQSMPIHIKGFFELESLFKGKKIFTVPSKFKNVNFLRFSIPANFSNIYNKKE